MIRVLFVCLGNICRSPMAEAVFRHKVAEAGLQDKITVDSAGTGGWHTGNPPHQGTRGILKAYGISDEGIRARQVRSEDFGDHQYIIAMDRANVSDLHAAAPQGAAYDIYRLMDFVPEQAGADVPDPYYTGNFEEVYGMVDAGCAALLTHIREKEQL